jgi:hypothetical protein
MNWLSNDKATWGIVLGILAIMLAFPLSLVANLVAPKIRNWWARRSAAALSRRIARLETELANAKKYASISDGEALILDFMQGMGTVAGGLSTTFLAIAWLICPSSPNIARIGSFVLILFGFSFTVALAIVLRLIERSLNMRSSRGRNLLQENLTELAAKLQSLQKS